MIEDIFIIALLNTTILICLKKWGVLEWYSIRRPLWMPAADCYLCLSLWLGIIECLIIFFIRVNLLEVFIAPFCSCAITNYLTNTAIINDYNNGRK